jgi:hemerythrin-like domain-containing protein
MLLKIGQRPDHGFSEPLGLLSDCHRRIEHFLEALRVIAAEATGGTLSDSQREQVERCLAYFETAAPRHTADEEESLFPRLKQGTNPERGHVLDVLARLEHDHSIADEHHRCVGTLVQRWLTEGRLATEKASELVNRLAALHEIYEEHIAIEEREVFPAASRLLSSGQLREVGAEMAARRRPSRA